MDIEALRAKKSSKLLELRKVQETEPDKHRKIRELANEVATMEGQLGQLLLSAGRHEDAAVNLISQASCLEIAGRLTEARRIYQSVVTLTSINKLKNWIKERTANIPADSFDVSIFQSLNAHIDGNEALRVPQLGAYHAARDHFQRSRSAVIIQLPVGCGKSGTIAILPFNIAQGRVLVVAPNLEIRRNLAKTLSVVNSNNFWKKTGVLSNGKGPITATLDPDANHHDCDGANIVVANIQQLTSRRKKWLDAFSPDYFDMIIIDEAHHAPAQSWQDALGRFPSAKVASFTATPLRSDGKKLDGKRIYRYPIAEAIRKGYIKDLAAREVAPSEVFFNYRGQSHRHSLEEVISLKEADWFSRGVALSRQCNIHIVDASIQSMEQLRNEGTKKHQIIAAACSIDHAKAIRSLYSERGLQADVLHSDLPQEEQDAVRQRLESGSLDVVVQVSMLGEGADYPQLSVAAIFRPFRHLVPYMQFIGRTMRVIEQNEPGHPDNRAFVVSHTGLNVDRWWRELQSLEEDDQEILEQLVNGSRTFQEEAGPQSGRARTYRPDMEIMQETLSGVLQQHYLGRPLSSEEKEDLVEELLQTLRLKGFDPEALGLSRDLIRTELQSSEPKEGTIIPFVSRAVDPQQARKEARKRIDERSRSAAKEVLNRLGLPMNGRQLIRLGFGQAQHNLAVAIILMNKEVNKRLGIESNDRNSLSTEALQNAHDSIDEAIAAVVEDIQNRGN